MLSLVPACFLGKYEEKRRFWDFGSHGLCFVVQKNGNFTTIDHLLNLFLYFFLQEFVRCSLLAWLHLVDKRMWERDEIRIFESYVF